MECINLTEQARISLSERYRLYGQWDEFSNKTFIIRIFQGNFFLGSDTNIPTKILSRIRGRQERENQMTVSTNDLVRDIVYETVAQHLGLKIDEVKEDMDASKDAGTFYRIIVDIEQRLGLSSSEGDWVFEEASIQGLEDYYKNILGERL